MQCEKIFPTIFVTYLIVFANGYPLNFDKERLLPSNDQIKFMQRFGYLEGGDAGQAQYSQGTIYSAVRSLQKFGGIDETGILDNETIKLMTKRRCGVKDIVNYKGNIGDHRRFKRYITVRGWKKRVITYFIANWTSRLGKNNVEVEIKKAFDVWAQYGKLKFVHVENSLADIIIEFGRGYHGDTYPFDGQGGILAHAFFPYESRFGGDMHFDDDEMWSLLNEEESTNFFAVAVHELGHVLGLAHSPVPTSIMFPYYRSDDSALTLDYDDMMGMYKLYIENTFIDDSKNEDSISEKLTTTTDIATMTENYDLDVITTESYKIIYEGDVETVDDHKLHDNKHGIQAENSDIDLCDGDYDSIAVFRQELFIFRGKQVWRLKSRRMIDEGYPVTIEQMFGKLPENIKNIDAAYERLDGNIVLFTGNQYWVYGGNHFIGEARSLRDYGIPDSITHIDAVQLWPKNDKTYLYRDDYFWRFDEKNKSLDSGYPKNISRWRGIPPNINGAFTWEGYTYFFKNLKFWRFDNIQIKANKYYPLPVLQYWFGCSETEDMFLLMEKN